MSRDYPRANGLQIVPMRGKSTWSFFEKLFSLVRKGGKSFQNQKEKRIVPPHENSLKNIESDGEEIGTLKLRLLSCQSLLEQSPPSLEIRSSRICNQILLFGFEIISIPDFDDS